MDYQLFLQLYGEAKESKDLEYFIGVRGWQEWMDEYETDQVILILTLIYQISTSDIVANRKLITENRVEFARAYRIPAHTVQDWELGKCQMPNYIETLLNYTIFQNVLIEGSKAKSTVTSKDNIEGLPFPFFD